MIVLAEVVLTMSRGFLPYSNDATRSDLKKLPALPTQALKEHPSLAYWWETSQLSRKTATTLHKLSLSCFPLLLMFFFSCTVSQWRPGRRALQEAQRAVQRASYCKVSVCVCLWLCLFTVLKAAFSVTLTCLSLCSPQLYEHCRVSAHIWSTLLCCKGTVLLLCLFFFHTHTTHIFVDSGPASREFGIWRYDGA